MNPSRLIIVLGALLLLATGCGLWLPEKKMIDVPFSTQAPLGDWSEPWLNACEETSIFMVSSFYTDDEIKRDEAVKKIQEILRVKNQNFKVSADESLQTISDLIDKLDLPWHATIVYDPSVETLKAELAKDRPIIVPVFAPALSGSGYQGDGPDYHVLVLTGYDDTKGEFTVNDPGTQNGDGLHFAYDVFMKAIHDLNPQDYDAGKKAVLFTEQDSWDDWFKKL